MATSGALGGFLQAMLQLRAQRLQEEENKTKAQTELMSGIGQGLGSVFKGIGGAMETSRKDQAINQMMNQMMPPSATAVNPAMQAKFTGTSRTPFTGGQAGFQAFKDITELQDKISTGKADELRKAAAADRAQGYYDIRAREASASERAAELKARNDAYEAMSKQAKDVYNDTGGYLKASQGFLDDIRKSQAGEGDPAAYKIAADELTKMNAVHTARKLTTPLVDVPVFFPEAQQKLLSDYNTARDIAAGAPATKGLLGRESPEARGLREAGAEAATGGPGGIGISVPYPSGAPRYAPANTPLPAELVNRAQQTPQQVTPEEAKQLGMQLPPPAGQTARPAPGTPAVPLMKRNPNTGQIWNPKTNQIWNPKTGQWETR